MTMDMNLRVGILTCPDLGEKYLGGFRSQVTQARSVRDTNVYRLQQEPQLIVTLCSPCKSTGL